MVQFLSIIFFSWISSIFVGFFKSSRIFVSLSIRTKILNITIHMRYLEARTCIITTYVHRKIKWGSLDFLFLILSVITLESSCMCFLCTAYLKVRVSIRNSVMNNMDCCPRYSGMKYKSYFFQCAEYKAHDWHSTQKLLILLWNASWTVIGLRHFITLDSKLHVVMSILNKIVFVI